MKECNIFCVEFQGNDFNWYQETCWHTSKEYCKDYISKASNPQNLRIKEASLIVD